MICFYGECNAQTSGSYLIFAETEVSVGDTEGSLALSFNIDKGLGKKGRIIVGLGGQITSYLRKNQYYVTAPAELTSGSTAPE